jgi:exopolysaccharide biosynthesis polyprenyl glycosylphosphotransferase
MTAAPATPAFWSTRAPDSPVRCNPPKNSKRGRSATVGAILLATTDFALIWVSAAVTLSVRLSAGAINYGNMLAKNAGSLMVLSILVVLFCQIQQLYEVKPRTFLDEALTVLEAFVFATLVVAASIYLSRQEVVSRVALAITVLMSAALLVGWRYVWRRRVKKRTAAGQGCRNVLIFGWSQAASLLERHFQEDKWQGYIVKGFIDRRRVIRARDRGAAERRTRPARGIGHIEDLATIVRTHFIDELFVFLPEDRDVVMDLIALSRESGINLRVVPDFYDGMAWDVPIERLGPFAALHVHEKPIPVLGLIFKRFIDVVGSAIALIIAAPLCFLIAVAIRLDSDGPIFYRSDRVGRKGAIFTCCKFRTMVQNADALREELRHRNERDGVLFKIAEDPRITGVGRFLRKYSLDEIPQFWNVLNGDMSLVGPRPPIPGEYAQYEIGHLKRLQVLPGITGLWQVEARRDASFESYINLDTHYVDHWNVWLDFKILLKTVAVVVAGTGQ